MKKKESLRVLYAQAVYDNKEINRVLSVLKERRTAVGRETEEFEKRVSKKFGKEFGIMTNSGSSANLVALDLLNLKPGSEVVTPLLTFSTTVAPLVQKNLIPVFVDVEDGTYVIDVSKIEKVITSKTKAIAVPLLLGNVPNMKKILEIAKKHKLYIIEDSCDTFGAKYAGKPTGRYTDVTVTSFYGSHVITAAAGGGMLMVNNVSWSNRAKVLRGWGRRSSLFRESENIEKRFGHKLGNVTYDAKFIFDEVGYNFLPLEISAAFGNAQLDKFPKFKKARRENFRKLLKIFKKYEDFFTLPVQDKNVDTSWLAFPITLRKDSPFDRIKFVKFLEENNIQTRPIFTGNVLKQPGFKKIVHKIDPEGCPITDIVMERGFVIGCHQGLTDRHLEKVERTLNSFMRKF